MRETNKNIYERWKITLLCFRESPLLTVRWRTKEGFINGLKEGFHSSFTGGFLKISRCCKKSVSVGGIKDEICNEISQFLNLSGYPLHPIPSLLRYLDAKFYSQPTTGILGSSYTVNTY